MRDFYSDLLTYDEVSELCEEIEPDGGCVWEQTVAALGLSYEVEELTDVDDENKYDVLLHKVEQEQTPVSCHLGWGYDKSQKHAIVVTAVSEKEMEIMNPAPQPEGRIDFMPKDEFLARWQEMDCGAFWFVE